MQHAFTSSEAFEPGPLAWSAALLLVVLPATAFAGHLEESDLRDDGLKLEVEDLEVERDDHRVTVDYEIDSSDWNRANRAGLSLWLGIFVEQGREGSGQWDLWYSVPLVSSDGAAEFPEYMELDRDHVVARLIAVSNGTLLSPGRGLFTDGSIYAAVRGNHADDHSHGDTDDPHIRRHVELEHRSSALYSVDIHLSFVGSLHQYGWYEASHGFHRMRLWLRRQSLLTEQFHRHLHRHHAHACNCGRQLGDGSIQRSHHHHGDRRHHHRSGRRIEIRIE